MHEVQWRKPKVVMEKIRDKSRGTGMSREEDDPTVIISSSDPYLG